VKSIENASFPEPWDFEIFEILASYRGRAIKASGARIYMYVLEEENNVTGYVVWEEAAREGHILNLAVQEDRRNSGRGKELLLFAIRKLKLKGMESCILECRDNNAIARGLYESIGMTESDHVDGYYGDQDAVIYRLDL
jgi:ribosomal-protein-alanine N-acetyltransferase